MKKIIVKLFSDYTWQGKTMRRRNAIFFLLPGIMFINDQVPFVIGDAKGTHHVFRIVFNWLFLTLDMLQVEFFSKDKEQDDNTDAGHPGTIIFHEEES